ncbi:MAG: hypothetical protein A2284_09605 [Deltaproteobacteria bacterium RIFOXYA12_FULL_61_11]|nr:MAG: hypothetical protein A2284_09605 [Deltaproteobacteria bacterium RIFOXYA12_FULL_61_11]
MVPQTALQHPRPWLNRAGSLLRLPQVILLGSVLLPAATLASPESSSESSSDLSVPGPTSLTQDEVLDLINWYLLSAEPEDQAASLRRMAGTKDERLLPSFLDGFHRRALRPTMLELSSQWSHELISKRLIKLHNDSNPSDYPPPEAYLEALARQETGSARNHLAELYQTLEDDPQQRTWLESVLARYQPALLEELAPRVPSPSDPLLAQPSSPGPRYPGQITEPPPSPSPGEAAQLPTLEVSTDTSPPLEAGALGTEAAELERLEEDLAAEAAVARELQDKRRQRNARFMLIALNSAFGAYTMGTIAQLGGTSAVLYSSMGALVGGGSTYLWSLYQPFDYQDPTYIGTFGTWGALTGAAAYRIFDQDAQWTRLSSILGESLGLGYGILTTEGADYTTNELLFANLGGSVSVAGTVGLLGMLTGDLPEEQLGNDAVLYGAMIASGWSGFSYHLLAADNFALDRGPNLEYLVGASFSGLVEGYLLGNALWGEEDTVRWLGSSLLCSSAWYYVALHTLEPVESTRARNLHWLEHTLYLGGAGLLLSESFFKTEPTAYYASALAGLLAGKALGFAYRDRPFFHENRKYQARYLSGAALGAVEGAGWAALFDLSGERTLLAAAGSGLLGASIELYAGYHDHSSTSLLLPSPIALGYGRLFYYGLAGYATDDQRWRWGTALTSAVLGPLENLAFEATMPRPHHPLTVPWSLLGWYYGYFAPAALGYEELSGASGLTGLGLGYVGARYLANTWPAFTAAGHRPLYGGLLTSALGYGLVASLTELDRRPYSDLAVLSFLPGLWYGTEYLTAEELRPRLPGLGFAALTGAGTFTLAALTLPSSSSPSAKLPGAALAGSAAYFMGGTILGRQLGLTSADFEDFSLYSAHGALLGLGLGLLLPEGLREREAVAGATLAGTLLLPPLDLYLFPPKLEGQRVREDLLFSGLTSGYLGFLASGLAYPDDSGARFGGVLLGGSLGLLGAGLNRNYLERTWDTDLCITSGVVVGSLAGYGALHAFGDLGSRIQAGTMLGSAAFGGALFAVTGTPTHNLRPGLAGLYSGVLGLYTGVLLDLVDHNREQSLGAHYLVQSYDASGVETQAALRRAYGKALLGTTTGLAGGLVFTDERTIDTGTFLDLTTGLTLGTVSGSGAALLLGPTLGSWQPYALVLGSGYLHSFGLALALNDRPFGLVHALSLADLSVLGASQGALLGYGLDLDQDRTLGTALVGAGLAGTLADLLTRTGFLPPPNYPLLSLASGLGNLVGLGLGSLFLDNPHHVALVGLLPIPVMLPLGYDLSSRLPSIPRERLSMLPFFTSLGFYHGYCAGLLFDDSEASWRRPLVTLGGGALGLLGSMAVAPRSDVFPLRRTALWTLQGSSAGWGLGYLLPDGSANREISIAANLGLGLGAAVAVPLFSRNDHLIGPRPLQTLGASSWGLLQGLGWGWTLHYDAPDPSNFLGGAAFGQAVGYLLGELSQEFFSFDTYELLLLGSSGIYGGWLAFLFADLVEDHSYRWSLTSALVGSNLGIATSVLTLQPWVNANSTRLYIIKLSSLAGMGLFPAFGRLAGLPIRQGILIGGLSGLLGSILVTSFFDWTKESRPAPGPDHRPPDLDARERILLPVVTLIPDQDHHPSLMVGLSGHGF